MSPSQILKKAHRACKTGESLRAFTDRMIRPEREPGRIALDSVPRVYNAAWAWLENKTKQRPRSPERLAAKGSALVHGAAVLRSCAPTSHANARKASQ